MKKIDFEHGGIAENILMAAFPMLIAQVLSLLYSIVDRIYIGRLPGAGTAALGSSTRSGSAGASDVGALSSCETPVNAPFLTTRRRENSSGRRVARIALSSSRRRRRAAAISASDVGTASCGGCAV